eukprot:3598586-Amphidinium_carterae.1
MPPSTGTCTAGFLPAIAGGVTGTRPAIGWSSGGGGINAAWDIGGLIGGTAGVPGTGVPGLGS